MPLHIYYSDKIEDLADHLKRALVEERKKSDPPRENAVHEKRSDSPDSGQAKRGRPTMDDTERSSDPAKSKSGAQPKPSNPEGSL